MTTDAATAGSEDIALTSRPVPKGRSLWNDAWRRLKKDHMAIAFLAIVAFYALAALAATYNVTPAALALAWVMAQPGVIAIPKATALAPAIADLNGKTVCELWDWVSRGDQMFPIITEKDPENGRSRVRVNTPAGVTISSLGELNFLREVDVTNVVSDLRQKPIENPAHVPQSAGTSMLTFMQWAGEIQIAGERVFHGLSKNCKNCQN